jgi:hypothetical protein
MPVRRGTVASSILFTEPGAPTSVSGTAGNAQVSLSWTEPEFTGFTSITDYTIQYSTSATFASSITTFTDSVSSNTSVTVTGLTNGTTYYFRVAAVNAIGAGAYSPISAGVTPITVPTGVTNLTASASDRTISATWSAPSSDGGSAITSYTVETQLNSEAWVNQGSQSSGVSFTVRNNSAVTARSYRIRVTANNAAGAGTVVTSSSVTPNFGTPATPVLTAVMPTQPSSGNGTGHRQFTVAYDPLACSAFSNTQTFIKLSGYSYTNTANSTALNTTNSAAGKSWTISTLNAPEWNSDRNLLASETYFVFTRTWNTDGDYVDSAEASVTTTATQSYNVVVDTSYYVTVDTSSWGGDESYSDQTGTFTVTGNTFSQTSVYALPGVTATGTTCAGCPDGTRRYSISHLTIRARVVVTGINITTSSRNFIVDFSGTSTSAGTGGGTIDCLRSPFSTSSGTAEQSLQWNTPTVAMGAAAGGGRIRVRGAGSIGTVSTSPDQRIRVIVNISGFQQRWNVSSRQDLVPASRTDTYYY